MQFNLINSRVCVSAQCSEKVRERRARKKKEKKSLCDNKRCPGGEYTYENAGPMPISVEFKEEGKTKYTELIRIPYVLID